MPMKRKLIEEANSMKLKLKTHSVRNGIFVILVAQCKTDSSLIQCASYFLQIPNDAQTITRVKIFSIEQID